MNSAARAASSAMPTATHRARRQPLAERPRPHPRPAARRGARAAATASSSTPYWIPSEDAEDPAAWTGFDGIWVVPGSPYRSAEGAVAAARVARERGVPFLGTCGGFQHAVLMLARDLSGIADAAHAEYGPDGELVVVALECSLAGHEGGIRLRARLADRADHGRRAQRRALPLRLRPRPRLRRALGRAACGSPATTTPATSASLELPTTRSSSARCSSRSSRATARGRTRCSGRSRPRARRGRSWRGPPDRRAQPSRTTSPAALSSRSPRKRGWLSAPPGSTR